MDKDTCKNCCRRPINKNRSKRFCDPCLDKKKDKAKAYYAEHSEERKEYARNFLKRVKIERKSSGFCVRCGKHGISSRSKSLCNNCLDFHKEHASEYRKKTSKSKRLLSQYSSVSKNPEKYRNIKKKYYLKNKEKWSIYSIERRARKCGVGGNFTNSEWDDLLVKFDKKCLWCHESDNLEKDHVIPISRGGVNDISNIQPLCKKCNRKKWDKIIDFRPFGNIIMDWT